MIPSLNTLLGISLPNVALAVAGFAVGLALGFEFSPNHRYKRKIKKLKKRLKCIKGTLSVGKDIYDAIHTGNQLPFVCLIPCAKEDLLTTKASVKDYFAAQKA